MLGIFIFENVWRLSSLSRHVVSRYQSNLSEPSQLLEEIFKKIKICLQVASTSWFMNFLEMAGVHHDEIDIVMEEVAGQT